MKFALALVAAVAAPALAAPAVGSLQHHPGAADPTPTMAMPYVMKAGAGDLYEIQSSQVALRKSRNAEVRSLASMLIQHHRMTTRDVTAAARRAGLRPGAPMLEPHQRAMIADLERASARGFDRAFLDQQRTAHLEALNLHRTYARSGDRPVLRQVAGKAVPIIQRHIDRVRAIRVR
jgi:putative membrane protein